MPIYEYRCERGHTFEVMQRMSDDPVASCQTCASRVERVFHPVAVHFKGSGFYNTDYGTRKRSHELKEAGEGTGKSAKDDGSPKAGSDGSGSKESKSSNSSGPAKAQPASSKSASSSD